ncbi:hypothetical protein [Ilumatobacter sp.]|uniref:hypothetical protein n=1 Tax=Ilumatobacter sp. TaxID=1967498 RepID=UPI003750789B
MERLCERPGCSERASVAYGMRAEDLVFWLDRLDDAASSDGGVLCQRHADSMVVPGSWTLDDLRDPDLHLFRPPAPVEQPRSRVRRSHGNDTREVEQLELGVELAPDPPTEGEKERETEGDLVTDAPADVTAPAADPDVADEPQVWTPNFDTADDLGGLLSARSPLLARAFRGAGRPRESPGDS